MPRPLMYQPEPWTMFEMTSRCRQARYLLRPSAKANRLIVGCLARALELHQDDVRIYFVGMVSNHFHMIGAARTVEAKARFKCHFKTNLSKELGRLHRWTGGIFGRRSRDIPIEPDALESRLVYLASHGVKSGLVAHPFDWPGVPWLEHLAHGRKLVGVWYDRSGYHNALQGWLKTRRGQKPRLKAFKHRKLVRLAPLPHLEELPRSEQQTFWQHIADEAAKTAPGNPPVGADRIQNTDPHARPESPKSTTAPSIHTRCLATIEARRQEYAAFVDRYRAALERLLLGHPIEPDDPLLTQACLPRGLIQVC